MSFKNIHHWQKNSICKLQLEVVTGEVNVKGLFNKLQHIICYSPV